MEKEENQNSQAEDNNEIKENTDTDKTSENKDFEPEDKIKDLEDKLARAYAEIENQRRRFEKEKDEAFDYGGFSLARETLNLIDNLERSKLALENDEKLKNSDALNLLDNLERSKQSINNDQNLDESSKKKIMDHIEIILNDTLTIFKKNNIVPIVSINEKLDPNKHQAMMEIEDDSKESGIIVQEIQKGFMLKDRLLRPSLVGVSKKPQKTEEIKPKK